MCVVSSRRVFDWTRREFHLDGDPRFLKCCYCTVLDGYLARTNVASPVFAHIPCALFSPGGEIADFARMIPSPPGLRPQYNGLRMLNPLSVKRGVDDSYLRDYANMFPLFSLFRFSYRRAFHRRIEGVADVAAVPDARNAREFRGEQHVFGAEHI